MSFRRQLLKGLGWVGALRVFVKLSAFVKLAILARILSSQAFGQFGVAIFALSFFETLTETGVNQALIFSSRKIEELLDSAWIVSIVRGVAIAVLVAMSALPLGWYFHDPVVVPLILLIAAAPLLRGFVNPMIVSLVKELDFRKEFLFRSGSAAVDLVAAVAIGTFTHSSVAFVGALLLSAATDVILSFVLFTIRPRFRFLRAYISEIIGYGKWMTLSGVFYWIADQLDDFVVGRMYGMSPLGVYQTSYKIATLPVTEISGTVNQVAFPTLSKIRADRQKFRKTLFASILSSNVFGLSLAVVVGLFPVFIVNILLGPEWDEVIPIVRILAIFGALRTIESSFQPLFLATGNPSIPSIGNVIKVISLVIGLLLWGTMGLVGVSFAALFSVVFTVPYYAVAALGVLRR